MAKPPARERVDEILYSTLRAVYHFERALFARFGLGYQEICLLQLLRKAGGVRVGEAARLLEMPLFSATRLAQRLESDGFLDRCPDPEDGRAVRLELSGKGATLIAEIEEDNYRLIAVNAASLSQVEVEGFVMVAENLHRVLGVSRSAAEDMGAAQ